MEISPAKLSSFDKAPRDYEAAQCFSEMSEFLGKMSAMLLLAGRSRSTDAAIALVFNASVQLSQASDAVNPRMNINPTLIHPVSN